MTTTCCGSSSAAKPSRGPHGAHPLGHLLAVGGAAVGGGPGRCRAGEEARVRLRSPRPAGRGLSARRSRALRRRPGNPGPPAGARMGRRNAPPPAPRRPPRSSAGRSTRRARRPRDRRSGRSRSAPGRPAPSAATARRAAAARLACGNRLRTSSTCRRRPSASESVRSRTAPGSRSSRPPISRSRAAARVHGPADCSLIVPAKPSACSVSWSRSRSSRSVVRRRSCPGRGATCHRPA